MSSRSKDKSAGFDRRDFMRSIGVGAAGAASVAVVTVAPTPAAAKESAADQKKKRYNPNSPHVQAFYRTNRY